MATAEALLSSIGFTLVAIIVVFIALLYTLRLQRKALVSQTAVVDDHFAEKNQRQRQLGRAVELNEQILHALRDRR